MIRSTRELVSFSIGKDASEPEPVNIQEKSFLKVMLEMSVVNAGLSADTVIAISDGATGALEDMRINSRSPRSESDNSHCVNMGENIRSIRFQQDRDLDQFPKKEVKMNQSMVPATDDPTDTIIAMERAALDRWGKGDPSGFLENCAPDVVYFDPGQEMRIDGREALGQYYEAIRGKVFVKRYELLNPLVHQVGDAAVLTFNYVSYGGSEDAHRWNCTEVYRYSGARWEIIQTHWSYTLAVRA